MEQATARQIPIGDGNSYDYGWWIPPEDTGEYFAFGRGGQHIRVLPAYDTVVVATGSSTAWDEFVSSLAQALVDLEKPLPANPAGVQQLDAALKAIQAPPPAQPVPPLPAMAAAISGRVYELDPNPFGLTSTQLHFDGDRLEFSGREGTHADGFTVAGKPAN